MLKPFKPEDFLLGTTEVMFRDMDGATATIKGLKYLKIRGRAGGSGEPLHGQGAEDLRAELRDLCRHAPLKL